MKKILVYHPFGNQNVRAVLCGLLTFNMLQSFHTTVAVFRSSILYRTVNLLKINKLLRREYDLNLRTITHCYPLLELVRQVRILPKLGFKNISSGYINIELNKKVSKYIRYHHDEINGVYCYAHGALDIFNVCKKYGIKCFYDLPIEYYKSLIDLIELEKKANPLWANHITTYQNPKLLNIIDEELYEADCVLVASSYVKNSLVKYGFNSEKIYVIPYGFPDVTPKIYRKIQGKIRVLYVGGLHQMKGLSYMFEAMDQLRNEVCFTIIGSGEMTSLLQNELQKYNYLGSLSHNQVLHEMKLHDILLFPTLSDGFGLVVSEAMSQGTPVIVSDHCGAADLIHDGKNGWVIPSRSSSAIVEKLKYIIKDSDIIGEVGKNALATAQSRPWKCYYNEIVELVRTI